MINVTTAETSCLNLLPPAYIGRKGKKNRAVSLRRGEMMPTRERATRERARQNGGVVVVEDCAADSRAMVRHHRAVCECQLDGYLKMGKIDRDEFAAGLQYREAWQMKAQGIRTKDSLSSERIDGGGNTEADLMKRLNRKGWAERILDEAHKESGLTVCQSLVIMKVCGMDESVGGACDVRTLRRALEKLARFWHII